MSDAGEPLHTVAAFAKMLALSPKTVREQCRAGKLAHSVMPCGCLMIHDAEVQRVRDAIATMPSEPTVTAEEYARWLGISVTTVQAHCASGRLKAYRYRGRYLIPRRYLTENWVNPSG